MSGDLLSWYRKLTKSEIYVNPNHFILQDGSQTHFSTLSIIPANFRTCLTFAFSTIALAFPFTAIISLPMYIIALGLGHASTVLH